MQLGVGTLAISVLGFNLGIELMQLFIIVLIVPWLMLLSKTPVYKYFRVSGAAMAGIAAAGWVMERIVGVPNNITVLVGRLTGYGWWVMLGLAAVGVVTYMVYSRPLGLKKRLV